MQINDNSVNANNTGEEWKEGVAQIRNAVAGERVIADAYANAWKSIRNEE